MKTEITKAVWLDINSSYSHSSLALPAIEAQHPNHPQIEWERVSGTINSVTSTIIEELIDKNPDIIAYTAWLFTHQTLLEILSRYKKLRPEVIIIGGGPEYLGDNKEYLQQNRFINFILRGEGEIAFYEWFDALHDRDRLNKVRGVCFLNGEQYQDNGIAKVSDYESLKFPEESHFFDWTKPFIQIESTRGCFNSCAFCVSGADKPVRNLSIDTLRQRLIVAQKNGIRDIRLLDRTFNGTGQRAVDMLSLFEEFEEMNFHLEVHPALFNQAMRDKIVTLPEGLLHIEAGVQSLSQEVLDSTARFGKVEDVVEGLSFLCNCNNLIVHSDLIAGLPHYTLDMIHDDVRTLSTMGCGEIQLELLKLLPGTAMRGNSDLIYSPIPPYEVMETPSISYRELQQARRLSRMLDLYYNCTTWQKSCRTLIAADELFLKKFTDYLTSIDRIDSPMSQESRGILLFDYCKEHYPDHLLEVTVDWVMGGLSLRKGAGAEAKSYNGASPLGDLNSNERVYFIDIPNYRVWFSYDRSISHSTPLSLHIENRN